MKKYIVLVIIFSCIHNIMLAQYGDANRAANEGAILQSQNRDLNNTLNNIRDNMNRKSSSLPYGTTSTNIDPNTQEIIDREYRRIFGKLTAADQKYYDSIKIKEKIKQDQERAAARENETYEYKRYYGERDNYVFEFFKKQKSNAIVPNNDLTEMGYVYYLNEIVKRGNIKMVSYPNPLNVVYPFSYYTPSKYINNVNNLSFDSCIYYLSNCKYYPSFALEQLSDLRIKYPQKEAIIDSLELEVLPYFFGGSRPYASNELEEYAYAKCQYEMADTDTKTAVLLKIIKLYKKYPKQTLESCGKARIGFHPFKLTIQHFNLHDSTIFKYCTLILKTPTPHHLLTNDDANAGRFIPYSYTNWNAFNSTRLMRYIGDYSITPVANWLIEHRMDYLNQLTSNEWKEICTLQGISAGMMAWAFRGNSGKKYEKQFKNLYSLIKEEKK